MQTYTTSKSKENILRKIRNALREAETPQPFPEAAKHKASVFAPLSMPSLEETFALEFSKSGGHFAFCNDVKELAENLKILTEQRSWKEVQCAFKELFPLLIEQKLSFVREYNLENEHAEVCITACEAAIARTGSLLFSSRQPYGWSSTIYFPIHIVIVRPGQLLADIGDGFAYLQKKYKDQLPSMISLHTGHSRTTAIGNTLVDGGQGPEAVFCFFVNY